jgi:hypothetical protein
MKEIGRSLWRWWTILRLQWPPLTPKIAHIYCDLKSQNSSYFLLTFFPSRWQKHGNGASASISWNPLYETLHDWPYQSPQKVYNTTSPPSSWEKSVSGENGCRSEAPLMVMEKCQQKYELFWELKEAIPQP